MPGLYPAPLSTGSAPRQISTAPSAPLPTPATSTSPSPSPAPEACSKINSNMNLEILTLMEVMNDLQIISLFSSTVLPPLIYSNDDICCYYHLKGRCFTNFSRTSNHRTLSAAEAVILRDFLLENILQPDLGRYQNPSSRWMGGSPAVPFNDIFRTHLHTDYVYRNPTKFSNKIYSLGEFIALDTNLYLDHNSWEALL